MDSRLNIVRPVPLSVTISAAIHLVVGTGVAIYEPGREDHEDPVVTLTTIEVVPPSPEPQIETGVDVRFLDEPTTHAVEERTVPNKSRKRVVAATRGATGSASISTGAATGIETPGPRETPGTRSKYMDMRSGSRADLTLPTSRFDALDNAPAGTAPRYGAPKSGQLEDAAGGRKKSHQDVFVAKIDRDGTVKMTDTRNLQAELSWNPAKLLSGRFDINDYLMRRGGDDPYSSRKLKFLDDTRDERVELGKAFRQQQLQQTAMIMRKNLERAWASSSDYAARKSALFELWDEIIEADGSDEILAEASRVARKAVIGFIRARLPQGSEHAFTEGELVALNSKKQSAAKFAPYE